MRIRSAIGAIAVLLGTMIAVVSPVGSASAYGNCPGNDYVQRSYSYGGSVVAVLCFNANTNTDPATLQSLGKYRGVPKTMSLKVCKLSTEPYDCVTDSGTFSYYAGPITRPTTACQYFKAVMWDGNGTRIVNNEWYLCD